MDAEAAASAVIVDPSGWGDASRELPELVGALQTAVVRRRKVRLVYRGKGREQTERLVDPWGLVDKDDIWYLIAGTERGQRTFRVDRIVEAVVTDLPADRPADFDLAREWARVVDEMEQRRSLLSATVLIPARLLPVLRDHFGRHCTDDGTARRRPGPGSGGGADAADDRPAVGRLGVDRRGRRTRIGAGRARQAGCGVGGEVSGKLMAVRYIVIGAGAVGGSIGARLLRPAMRWCWSPAAATSRCSGQTA